jgi:enoyl-CoA hydratase/carnithine racemase
MPIATGCFGPTRMKVGSMSERTTFQDRVTVMVEQHVARVSLARPDKLNALDPAMFDGLIEAAAWVSDHSDIRAVVLTGEGRMFCAGLDFGSFAAMAGNDGDSTTAALEDRTHGLANRPQYAGWAWRECPVPVIAAISGGALGGGLQIALGADIRIATSEAKIAIAEIQWGLVPDMSGCAIARGLVRDDVMRRLTYTGERIDGRTAQSLGLVTEIADDPLERAHEIATQIAQRSPSATRAAKRLMASMADGSASEILLTESREQQALIGGRDQIEAVMANLEKRPPEFE